MVDGSLTARLTDYSRMCYWGWDFFYMLWARAPEAWPCRPRSLLEGHALLMHERLLEEYVRGAWFAPAALNRG